MRLSRKRGQVWHFADSPHCDWAETYTDEDAFEEHVEVRSTNQVNRLCSTCLKRRNLEDAPLLP